jgi:hypothetical protein
MTKENIAIVKPPAQEIHQVGKAQKILSQKNLCCNKHGYAGASGVTCVAFLWVYPQKWDCWIIWQVSV